MVIAEKRQIFDCVEKSVNPLIIIPQARARDAIGGSLALFLALKKIGKHPQIVCFGEVPEIFSFLFEFGAIERGIENERIFQLSFPAGERQIKNLSYEQNGGIFNIYFNAEAGAISKDSLKICSKFKYDLILTVAVRDLESLGEMYSLHKELFSSLEIINIDNSEINGRFGNINAIDSYYLTVSEVAAEIVQTILPLGYGEKIATAILAGIIAETNNFQSSVIKSETFALAGALLASGAQRAEIIKHFYGIDFGIGSLGGKNDLPERPKTENVRPDIKKEMLGEELKMIAAPVGNVASIPASAAFNIASSLKNLYQLNISIEKIWDYRAGFERSLLILRQFYFWIFLGLALAIIIFRAGSLNNIYLGFNNFWIRIYAPIDNIKGKIVQESFKLFLPQKTNSDLKGTNSESIYSASKTKKINIGLPTKLSIPRLGLEAQILEVGLDKSGTMETPINYKDVGWFRLGVRPGEIGNAVVTGHLDTADTANGIFRRLNEAAVGDDIFVMDSENNKLHFRVVSSRVYDAKNAPMEEIFGATSSKRLNLITCDGVWDQKTLSYNKRLVVFTEFVAGS